VLKPRRLAELLWFAVRGGKPECLC